MGNGRYEVMKNENSTIYLQREKSDKTWISNAHYHDSIEFCFYIKGRVVCHINGEACDMQEGEITVIDNLNVHYFELEKNSEYIAIRIGKDYMKDFYMLHKSDDERVSFPLRLQKSRENKEIFDVLHLFLKNFKDCNELRLMGYVNLILGTMETHYDLIHYTGKKKVLEKEILQYLHENISREITLKTMARHFGYSENAFSRKVHALIGQDLRTYLNYLRVKNALDLKRNEPSITNTAAAAASGFKSMNTFYRAYTKYMQKYQETDAESFYI